MQPTEPLPLHHSWPLFDRARHFELGWVAGDDPSPLVVRAEWIGIGRWSCDLADDSLSWSDAVYDLFGLPRGARATRAETLALYSEESRAAMERLRAYAIKHRRGFTLDARIRPAGGADRWMRLIAAPVCEGNRVVRLEGIKRDISSHPR